MRLLPFGERAVLAEVDGLEAVLALHAALTASRPPGVTDLVPAARTVLARVDPTALPLPAARAWIERAAAAPASVVPEAGEEIALPIAYDGADLAGTAALLGIGVDELVRRHRDAVWTVAFTGFAPGFGYLVSEDWPFDVPRLDAPRTAVPAGAVGLAGRFSGAYPRSSPGGWRLVGTTPAPLFDPAADRPALLRPGTRVRFVERDAVDAPARAARAAAAPVDPAFTVVTTGPSALLQDQGRGGHLAEGVAPSGAADRAALRTANRLVGNAEDAAGVEVLLGGFRAVAARDLWVAATGAGEGLRIAGREGDPYAPQPWPAGTELEVRGPFRRGARVWLAVRGGLVAADPDAGRVLGSTATDTMSGLGAAPLAAGAVVGQGARAVTPVPVVDAFPWTPPAAELVLPLAPGPREDWFTPAARETLRTATWTVAVDADRVGIRLDGPELERAVGGELASEAMLPGALQVPPTGRPVILGPDGPVTGGYPVIAVVTDAARDLLAQARPGTRIRFRSASRA